MKKESKIVIAALLGIFFSMATLEVDIFDYENDFFDTYDSFVKIDSKVTQRIFHVEFAKIVSAEIIRPVFVASHFAKTLPRTEPLSSNYFYRPKLFLLKSTFLI
ncbi:MAG: hypothetical protein HOP08_08365 [Cyclobacteriaceae bacterium]|nr:hypothetical protein [Cyclobacteriaceae bacterium]